MPSRKAWTRYWGNSGPRLKTLPEDFGYAAEWAYIPTLRSYPSEGHVWDYFTKEQWDADLPRRRNLRFIDVRGLKHLTEVPAWMPYMRTLEKPCRIYLGGTGITRDTWAEAMKKAKFEAVDNKMRRMFRHQEREENGYFPIADFITEVGEEIEVDESRLLEGA